MKKMKRIVAGLLVCAMMISVMAGCGAEDSASGNDAASSGKPSVQEQKESRQASASEDGSDDMSETVTITFTVPVQASEGDWNEYPFVALVEEKFNVDLQFTQIAQDIWDEKWPLLFASGELPDVFVTDVDTSNYGEQGYFLPLEEYISEELTPNIGEMWQAQPSAKMGSMELNGHIYFLRGFDVTPFEKTQNRFFININWAQDILGKIPETVDEFYTYLVGVRDMDMDGDGDTDNEIPLGGYYSATKAVNFQTGILAAFGHVSNGPEVQEDGSILNVKISDDYKEFLKYLNQLWSEGLIDSEYFTMDSDQFNAKEAAGIYGAFCNWAPYSNHPEDYKNYDQFEPMTSSINSEKMWPAMDATFVGGFCVNAETQNVERILKVMDWFFSEEGLEKARWGFFELGENEEYPDFGYERFTDDNGGVGYILKNRAGEEGVLPEGFDSETTFRSKELCPNYKAVPAYCRVEPARIAETHKWFIWHVNDYHYPYFKTDIPAAMKFTTGESGELALLEADITPYFEEMETKMIRGDVDIDAEWDNYVQGLKDRGLDRQTEIYQTAYDRYRELAQ